MSENKKLMEILEIGIQMAQETNRNHLLQMILDKSMEYANCDAGTLYVYENDTLVFKLMRTDSQGINKGRDGEDIGLPPVPLKEENICAYSAIHRQVLNIEDVRTSDMFDFSGPKRYDEMTGYRTKSMLVLPITNHEDKLIGVLQLINAMDGSGEVISFDVSMEPVIRSLTSQAAIVLSNLLFTEEIKQQMWSFTEALAETVDARTPYNGSHIRNVAKYAGMLADYYNKLYEQGKETEYFDTQRKEQLVMGALLHDIGKMIVPLEVMNKATRLDSREELVYGRLNLIRAYYEIDGLNGRISKEQADEKIQEIDAVKELIGKVNSAGFLMDELLAQLEEVLPLVYRKPDGEELPYFTEEEKESLRVRKGTLTIKERGIMESHVEMTERILAKVHFNSYYADSPVWAATHHECLDGSGYPKGLKADDLAVESRIMAVADICDALLASDRPYKKPMPKEKAFQIMQNMAEEGKLERKIVDYMQACMEEV